MFCPALECQGPHSHPWEGPTTTSIDEAEIAADAHDAERHGRHDLAPDPTGTPSLFGATTTAPREPR